MAIILTSSSVGIREFALTQGWGHSRAAALHSLPSCHTANVLLMCVAAHSQSRDSDIIIV